MIETNKKEQLRLMLSDFVGDGLMSLDEVAKLLKVSDSYLFGLIRRGKIKAFKVDEYWFIKLDWLEQFRQQICEYISEAVNQSEIVSIPNRWVRPVKRKKNVASIFFIFSFKLMLASLLLTFMVLTSAWMMPFPNEIIRLNEYLLSGVLAVSNIYAKPVELFSEVIVFGSKINDEKLTGWSRNMLGNEKNIGGRVAGASEGFEE